MPTKGNEKSSANERRESARSSRKSKPVVKRPQRMREGTERLEEEFCFTIVLIVSVGAEYSRKCIGRVDLRGAVD